MDEREFARQVGHADVLLSQNRFKQAEEILKKLLATGYEQSYLMKMMAVAKLGLGERDAAEELIKIVMSQQPDDPFLFYLLSTISAAKREFDQAKKHIAEAINLEPANSDFFAYKAHLLLQTKEYTDALHHANLALELSAENIDALNTRASALVALGRKNEAYETINKSLSTDPNNADTHANMGWGKLHHGEVSDALTHFKEALKNDPTSEYAKSGMLEAMKAKFPVYRYFLMLFLWLGKLKGNNQWAFIFGGYVAYRIMIKVAQNNPSLQPLLYPIIIFIFLLFISSWIFSPLMNLYLLTNDYGRMTLSGDQKQSAKAVGLSLSICLLCIIIYFVGIRNEGLLSTALLSFAMMIPFGSMNNPVLESNKTKLKYFAILIAIFVTIDSILSLYRQSFTSGLFFLPFVSLIAYQFYANYLIIRE